MPSSFVPSTLLAALTALIVVSASPNDVFWVVSHAPLMSTRLDPILSPGLVSSHTHQIVGASSFAPTYSYENNRAAKCTTANVAADLSNYWAPQMYRKYDNGSLGLVPLSYVNTYYQMRRQDNEPVYEFPEGFRMMAGNAMRSTNNVSSPADNAVAYTCLNFNAPATEQTAGFPTTNCPDGLRAQVYFPHCWDGINNWLEGSAHVVYADGTTHPDGGEPCPKSHPKRIMGLFYEFIFKDDYDYEPGARVLATGDDVGYSFHGDFTNGWPAGLFQKIFDYGSKCYVEFDLASCPALSPYFVNNGSACSPEGVIVDEDIGYGNNLTKLPGDNPIWGGSVAKATDPNYKDTQEFEKLTPDVPSDWKLLGCIAEGVGSRALAAATTTSDSMSPDFCISFCAGKGYKYAGIEYSDECYCDNTFSGGASASNLLTDGSCGMPCPSLLYASGYCGGSAVLSLYEYTGSGSPSVGDVSGPQLVTPSGGPNPTQILASNVQMDTVSGDGAWTGYTGPAVGEETGSGADAPTSTGSPSVTSVAAASGSVTSIAAVSSGAASPTSVAGTTTPTSVAGGDSTLPSTSTGSSGGAPVLVAEPSSTTSASTSASSAVKSCSRSRKKRSLHARF